MTTEPCISLNAVCEMRQHTNRMIKKILGQQVITAQTDIPLPGYTPITYHIQCLFTELSSMLP